MAEYRLADVAKAISNLLNNDKQLNRKITDLEGQVNQAQAAALGSIAAPVPYSGTVSLLSPHVFYAVRATAISTVSFTGYRQRPTGVDAAPWEDDPNLDPITVHFVEPASPPGDGDIVFAGFIGSSGATFTPAYGYFDARSQSYLVGDGTWIATTATNTISHIGPSSVSTVANYTITQQTLGATPGLLFTFSSPSFGFDALGHVTGITTTRVTTIYISNVGSFSSVLVGDGTWIATTATNTISHIGPATAVNSVLAEVTAVVSGNTTTFQFTCPIINYDQKGHISSTATTVTSIAINTGGSSALGDGTWIATTAANTISHIGPSSATATVNYTITKVTTVGNYGSLYTFSLPSFSYDSKGHVTGIATTAITTVFVPDACTIVQTVVTDIRVDGSTQKIQKKVRPLLGLWTDDESGWIDVHTGTTTCA